MPVSPTPTQIEVFRQIADPEKVLQEPQAQAKQLYTQASILASRSRLQRKAAVAIRNHEPERVLPPPSPIPSPVHSPIAPPPIQEHFPEPDVAEVPKAEEKPQRQEPPKPEPEKVNEDEEVASARAAWFQRQREEQENKPGKRFWQSKGAYSKEVALENVASALVFGAKAFEGLTTFTNLKFLRMQGLEEKVEEAVKEKMFDQLLNESVEVPWIAEVLGNSKFSALSTLAHIMANTHKENVEKEAGGFRSSRPKMKKESGAFTQEQFEQMMETYEHKKKERENPKYQDEILEKKLQEWDRMYCQKWDEQKSLLDNEKQQLQKEREQMHEQLKKEKERLMVERETMQMEHEKWKELYKEQHEHVQHRLNKIATKHCNSKQDPKQPTQQDAKVQQDANVQPKAQDAKAQQDPKEQLKLQDAKVQQDANVQPKLQDAKAQRDANIQEQPKLQQNHKLQELQDPKIQDAITQHALGAKQQSSVIDPFRVPLPEEESKKMVLDAISKTPRPTFSSETTYTPYIDPTKIRMADSLLSHMMKKEEPGFQEVDPDALEEL
jgi:hypothetical protein